MAKYSAPLLHRFEESELTEWTAFFGAHYTRYPHFTSALRGALMEVNGRLPHATADYREAVREATLRIMNGYQ